MTASANAWALDVDAQRPEMETRPRTAVLGASGGFGNWRESDLVMDREAHSEEVLRCPKYVQAGNKDFLVVLHFYSRYSQTHQV